MEQGFLELTADGNKPEGGSVGESEGRWARSVGLDPAGLGPLPCPTSSEFL